jgi:hypothetical protein
MMFGMMPRSQKCADESILLFGGHGGDTGLPYADTWLWRRTA